MNSDQPSAPKKAAGFLSIIVPVFNEAGLIGGFLQQVRAVIPDAELIVADGGSTDGTRGLATASADRVVETRRGRAAQMNAGAALAGGEVLWFLHVDSALPLDAAEQINALLQNGRVAGGCFRLRIPRSEWVYRISDRAGNLAVDLFRLALGDHGIFCRRAAFQEVGGFPDVPILEDAELYRKLRRRGTMRQLPAFLISSPRTYERLGAYRTTAVYVLILALYVLAVPIPFLHKIYRWLQAGSGRGAELPAF